MKHTTNTADKTNFAIGVSRGFGAMKNRIGFTIIGLLLGLVGGFKWANYNYREAQGAASNAEIAKAAAKIASQPDQRQQAVNEVMELIRKARENPNDFDLQRKAAEQFMQIQRPAGALPFLTQANKLKPENADVMADLAAVYYEQRQFSESVSWARKAVAQDANHPLGKFYLMSALIESQQSLNEADKLLTELEATTKAKNAPADAQNALAQMRERLQSARQGKTSLQHGPSSPDALGGKK
ncbi:MAG: tetratricopeptide repeat protein [Acidobacteria bacterium]|nr:tetratricopeptide repeat protein [Acidobacteriota bacterium]